jgi:RNA polymerase sigma factor (sigma-70 family)
LVSAAQAGDKAALEHLLAHHLRAAHSLALATVRCWEDAADVVQAAFLLAVQKLGECHDPACFSGWLLQIVRRSALDHLRSRARSRLSFQDDDPELTVASEPQAADGAATSDSRRALLAALATLPERQRQVVLLHDLEGWKHGEIAVLLQISETMSRQELFVARRELRVALAPDRSNE